MGVLAERFETVRSRSDWLTEGDNDAWQGRRTPSGVTVNRETAFGLPVFWRCVDLLRASVAHSPKDIILKIGSKSFPEFTKPGWLTAPNPDDPTFTIDDYFSQVALSALVEGNYFVRVFPYVLDPQVLMVLDPMRVGVRRGPLYDLLGPTGQVIETIGPMQMLHGSWIRMPGALRGIPPLEVLRRSIGSAVAADEHAARFFGQGASLSFGVEVPGELDDSKKAELSKAMKRKYAGLQNSHAVGVLTGGAKFITGLAPTPEQAQMLETRKFSVEEICRPFGVPPSLVGSQEPGAASYASAEVNDKQFAERAVLPLAEMIEAQHDRLLEMPIGISDPNASMQFKFNLDWLVRTNILTRFQAYSAGVQGGVLTPNEARGYEDKVPMKGGELLYMQQQMVPLGDLGQTKATEPLITQPAPAGG